MKIKKPINPKKTNVTKGTKTTKKQDDSGKINGFEKKQIKNKST